MTLPAGRYPSSHSNPGRRRQTVVLLAALVVAAAVALAFYAYKKLDPSAAPISANSPGYKVLNDSSVQIKVDVTRNDPSRPASCIVRSRSKKGDEVGRREVLIPPSRDKITRVTTTLSTSARPFTGEIYGCGYNPPSYLTQ